MFDLCRPGVTRRYCRDSTTDSRASRAVCATLPSPPDSVPPEKTKGDRCLICVAPPHMYLPRVNVTPEKKRILWMRDCALFAVLAVTHARP